MGWPRTVAPPRPQQGTEVENGSVGTMPRHTASTNGARLEHGTLVRCEYGLLAPLVTAVDPDNAGDPGSAASHGATGEQDGREPEEGDKTLQRALAERGMREARDEGRVPPQWLRVLNACVHQGGERGGGTPTQQHVPTAHIKGPGETPNTATWAPTARPGPGGGRAPQHQQCAQHVHWKEGGGSPQAGRAQTLGVARGLRKGGNPTNGSVRYQCTACKQGREGSPKPGGRIWGTP